MPEYFIRHPEKEWFKAEGTHEDLLSREQEAAYHIKGEPCRPDGDGYGCYTWYEGIPFPRKCAYDLEFSKYNNILKRLTMGMVRMAGSKQIILPGLGFALLPWKHKIKLLEKVLGEWCRMGEFVMAPCMWKDPKRWCTMVRELQKFISLFLTELGINEKLSIQVAEVAGAMLEYDDSYRYRAQDLFGEINKVQLFEDPVKEIKRVLALYKQREHTAIDDKFEAMVNGLGLLLKVPKIKRAFRATAVLTRWEALGLDQADKYWAFKKTDYDFCGMNLARREFYINQIHGVWDPPAMSLR